MSKGSGRRPASVSDAELAARSRAGGDCYGLEAYFGDCEVKNENEGISIPDGPFTIYPSCNAGCHLPVRHYDKRQLVAEHEVGAQCEICDNPKSELLPQRIKSVDAGPDSIVRGVRITFE